MPDPKLPKQSTLDKLPVARPKDALEILKQPQEEPIEITQIQTTIKEGELLLKVSFKIPVEKSFSRVQSNLFFDTEPISSVIVRMLPRPLATAESEFSVVFDMQSIGMGTHIIGVEMFGLWGAGEKLCRAFKELQINYVPLTRQSRFLKIPTVRSVAGADVIVVSEGERGIYKNLERSLKKERNDKRESW